MEDKRIAEALELLNSVAKDKKADLEKELTHKFTDFKSLLETVGEKVKHRTVDTLHHGKERAEEALSEVDKSVHKNPWPYIGGVAVAGLLIGYLLGRPRK